MNRSLIFRPDWRVVTLANAFDTAPVVLDFSSGIVKNLSGHPSVPAVRGNRIAEGVGLYFNGEAVVSFPTGFGVTNSTSFYITVGVTTPRTARKGAFLKFGDQNSGIGLGIGDTSFDTTGTNWMGLIEAIAWAPTTTNACDGKFHVATMQYDSAGGWTIYVDGASIGTAASGVNNPVNATAIGGYYGVLPSSFPRFMDGGVIHFAIVGTLSAAARFNAEINPLIARLFPARGWTKETKKTRMYNAVAAAGGGPATTRRLTLLGAGA